MKKAPLMSASFALAWFLGTGCGLSHTVDIEMLEVIPIEYKLELFDAENDVAVAVDEKALIERAIREVKGDIDRVYEQIDEAVADAERAATKGESDRQALSERAEEVFELKIEYLQSHRAWLRSKLSHQ